MDLCKQTFGRIERRKDNGTDRVDMTGGDDMLRTTVEKEIYYRLLEKKGNNLSCEFCGLL